MFKLVDCRTAWMDCNWQMLAEDGSVQKCMVRLKVELVHRDDLQAASAGGSDGGEGTKALATRVVLDWEGVGDAEGRALPFSAADFARLYGTPGFALGFLISYHSAWSGQVETREKNSQPSRPAGADAAPQPNQPPAG